MLSILNCYTVSKSSGCVVWAQLALLGPWSVSMKFKRIKDLLKPRFHTSIKATPA